MKLIFSYIVFISSILAQISPGDLTEFHKHLEGISNCVKCHELGEEVKNEKCLDCHTVINALLNNNKGYHSFNEVKSQKCYSCHSEHHGRDFQIIRFDKHKFDHTQTKFELTGKHSKINCEDCHKPEFILDENLKERKATYLGLSNNCNHCHEDPHIGTLGVKCNACHNTEKFIPAVFFDHNSAKFKLTGVHIKIECQLCHKIEIKNGKKFQVFTGIKFSRCSDCHHDIHQGKFGSDCESCHSAVSFKIIKNLERFDHSKTNYPLRGNHRFVECVDCHKTSMSSKPQHEKCIDCHDDFHKGEFTLQNKIKDCLECHIEEGFSPSTYTLELHQTTKFPLTGAHLALPCGECHKKENHYQFLFHDLTCIQCHENFHGGAISFEYFGENNCEYCHSTTQWSEVKFDHNKTDFKLLGKHNTTSCVSCHFIEKGGITKQVFKELDSSCEKCHKDVHFNQFIVNGTTDCSRCHGFTDWEPVNFDHSKSRFPLVGAHAKISCEKCHKKIHTPNGDFIKYKYDEIKCKSCHLS